MNRHILAIAGALVLACGAAQAQVVVRDAQTGQLRAPTAAEVQMLEQVRARTGFVANRGILTGTINPQPVRQPDGSDFLETTEGDLNYSVVVRSPSGRLVRQCVANPELAARLVRGEVTAFAKNLLESLNER
jgi:hypothetical protein